MIRYWLVILSGMAWFFFLVARGDSRVASGAAFISSILWSWMFFIVAATLLTTAIVL